MVRLYKLSHAYLDQTCQRRGEISFILGRLLFETVVNIKYLIEHFSKDLIDSYVRHSLRQERALRDAIQSNIKTRGSTWPIEDRMMKSISRAERAAGISLDDIDLPGRGSWGGKKISIRRLKRSDLEMRIARHLAGDLKASMEIGQISTETI